MTKAGAILGEIRFAMTKYTPNPTTPKELIVNNLILRAIDEILAVPWEKV